MKLANRIAALQHLKDWLIKDDDSWRNTKQRAYEHNKWFTPEFVNDRIQRFVTNYLDKARLDNWVAHYHIDDNIEAKKIGLVMAGNIPMVGFHDLISVFIAGHHAIVKLSEKDQMLTTTVINKLKELDPEIDRYFTIAEILKGCDAYIATGSNNTSRYFEYYFGKYPSIIRKNKTSVAILTGMESDEQLTALADDIFLYFGLGCRNVTQLYVPENYDFQKLLNATNKYAYLKDHDKYRNNYDYNLALLIMNNRRYMCNDSIILVEGDHLFSPVSELYYACYSDAEEITKRMMDNQHVQCIVGKGHVDYGKSQDAGLFDYADGVDVMQFLLSL